jgi:predicted nucleic acid-binding protein
MFLDTSGLYAWLSEEDERHAEAISLIEAGAELVTHNYVLAELVALCHARKGNRTVVLAFLDSVAKGRGIDVKWVDRVDHGAGVRLLRERADKTYSLCDAVSFVVMRRLAITDALSTDRHFEQEGFRRLLRS